MDIPETWQGLSRFLGVPDRLSRVVWAGVRRAQWSTAVELRQAFLLHEPIHVETGGVAYAVIPFAVTGLTAHAASPAKLITAVEACVREQVLARKDASQFEEYVLAGMGYDACAAADEAHRRAWLPSPAPEATRWLTRGEREARTAQRHTSKGDDDESAYP